MPERRVGVWCCDAGKASGIASCVVDLGRKTSSLRLLREREHSESHTVAWSDVVPEGVEDGEMMSAWLGVTLGSEYARWAGEMRGLGVLETYMVLEQFRLRDGGLPGKAGLEVLLPLTINVGILSWLGVWNPGRAIFVNPSDGMGVMTNDRLRAAGCWVRGREHERDAWRYLGVALRRLRKRKAPPPR